MNPNRVPAKYMTLKNWRWWAVIPLFVVLLPTAAAIIALEHIGGFLEQIGSSWDRLANRRLAPLHNWVQRGGMAAWNRRAGE